MNTRSSTLFSDDLLQPLRAQAAEAEQLGQLPPASVALLRASGVTRMLQPRDWGGLESHPADFMQAIMTLAAHNPSAGWVAGVVGVHAWEAALNDERLLNDLWRDAPDNWIASPYAPMGVATPHEDGYRLTGRWTFSSGTDHCQWIVLGALTADASGKPLDPPQVMHVMLPRKDYHIVPGSWQVMGLQGTGSKDVTVEDVFIPAYRCLSTKILMNGQAYLHAPCKAALYRMPWSSVFPNAITAAVLGMCEGAMQAALALAGARVQQSKNRQADPFLLVVLGEAASEVRAAQTMLLHNVTAAYEAAQQNRELTLAQRAANRSEQVRGAWRAVRAVNEVFNRSGGAALKTDTPLHRFWRDANAGLNHATFNGNGVYQVQAALALDLATPQQIDNALI